MSTIQDLFQQAQLTEAAYASFVTTSGVLITDDSGVISSLQIEGFSESQATDFVASWKIVWMKQQRMQWVRR